jgi:hypothetical protein
MNLTYVTESGAVDTGAVQKLVQNELGLSIRDLRNLNVTIKFEKKDPPSAEKES